jgi:hypothetical protein
MVYSETYLSSTLKSFQEIMNSAVLATGYAAVQEWSGPAALSLLTWAVIYMMIR